MDIKQTSEDITGIWAYLPATDIMFQYLNIYGFIELGKCCKLYRKQVESQIWKKSNIAYWSRNNSKLYEELEKSCKIEKVLGYMEADLGSKLKFVKEFNLNCKVDYSFAQSFVKLLPNIKTLNLFGGGEYSCCLGEGLKAILKGVKHLERVYIGFVDGTVRDYSPKNPIFPKSIKYLKINIIHKISSDYNDGELSIYDTIDTSYINLYSLTIVSNRTLQNLSSGISNLKEVELSDNGGFDQLKIVEFLKANPQLIKLKTGLKYYNEEIIKTILFLKHLERWCIDNEPCIDHRPWKEIELNGLPFNYSINYLKISINIPTSLTLQLINSCKVLENLKFDYYEKLNDLDLSKLVQRVNILNLNNCYGARDFIAKIDSSRLFNKFYINGYKYIKVDIENYDYIQLISGSYIFTLINKTN
jgi:hypothetical protein